MVLGVISGNKILVIYKGDKFWFTSTEGGDDTQNMSGKLTLGDGSNRY